MLTLNRCTRERHGRRAIFRLDVNLDLRTIEIMLVVKTIRPGFHPTYEIQDGYHRNGPVVMQGDYLVEHYQPSVNEIAYALDLYVAELLGAPPSRSLSSHIAMIVSEVTGVPFARAKTQFHRVLARLVAGAIHHHAPRFSARKIERSLFRWLESFDPSNMRVL